MKHDRILVIITRRIGDVLLATPVIRSLKRAFPEAQVDALVFNGTQGVLHANPDLRSVITVPERPELGEHVNLHTKLFRSYDIALSLTAGDRPTLYAWSAGRLSAGLQTLEGKSWWKRRLLDIWIPFDDLDTHTVRMNLALVQALDVPVVPEVVVSWTADDARRIDELDPTRGSEPYAVVHPAAKFNYKMWHPEGWVDVSRWLIARGMRIYVTGGSDPAELDYASALTEKLGSGAVNLAGKLTLGAVGCLLSRAALYVGPDTAITHMSAALGTRTVALFGPTNPVKWGPWPKGHAWTSNPWQRVGTQYQGNVLLVQGASACVPCMLEGCERHVASYSDCLQQMSPRTVIAAMEATLLSAAPA